MGRRILITGTRSGLGKLLAQYYLDKDYIVFGCSRGRASLVHKDYYHKEIDLCNERDVVCWVKDILKEFGGIDVLVNNAAIGAMNSTLLAPQSQNQFIFETNIIAVMTLCREVGKVMLKEGNGKIINITSIASKVDLPGEAAYAASKAALESYTRTASKELASTGLTINSVSIPLLGIGMTETLPEVNRKKLIEYQAIKKVCEISDITNVIDFFASSASRYLTGQNLVICGS